MGFVCSFVFPGFALIFLLYTSFILCISCLGPLLMCGLLAAKLGEAEAPP